MWGLIEPTNIGYIIVFFCNIGYRSAIKNETMKYHMKYILDYHCILLITDYHGIDHHSIMDSPYKKVALKLW